MAKSNKIKFDKNFEDDMEEFDDEFESEEADEEEEEKEPPKTKNFAYWNVGEKSYRLKLKTKSIEELETKYRTNLVNLMGSENGMPPLKTMLDITHCAMKEWHHKVRYEHVVTLFDRYVDEGGSQLSFYTDIFMNIYIVSGFFSKAMAAEMTAAMSEATKMM